MNNEERKILNLKARGGDVLTQGKIDWEYQLTQLIHEIDNCQKHIDNLPESLVSEDKIIWEKQLANNRDKLLSLIEAMTDKEKNDKIEFLAKEIQSWTHKFGEGYPWEDIALSILRDSTTVKFDCEECQVCGTKTIKCYFSSPDWTWLALCGSSGEMTICPHCHTQSTHVKWKS